MEELHARNNPGKFHQLWPSGLKKKFDDPCHTPHDGHAHHEHIELREAKKRNVVT